MKSTPVAVVVVVVVIAAAMGGAMWAIGFAGQAATSSAEEGVRSQELEAMRRTADSEERFGDVGPTDAEPDLVHLSLEVLPAREGAPTPRLTLLWSADSPVPVRFDTQTDEIVLETAAGQAHALDLRGFFELEEMKLNPGERSMFVSLAPSRVEELGAVRAVFRRHVALGEPIEVAVELD